ncbi:alpha/beta hydrolase [Salinactinospora qingdaonensis]|uniref:Alpha/beta hydrolase n=1 Tax=Salinactinospora qingdaonensis TaxID=702744 RepID=A0ABP7FKV5_9ACTN
MTREDITFTAGDVELHGWVFHPDTQGPAPTIVMAHGLAAVKEQYLDRYAERFAAAGLRTIVYDHRNFGSSAGEPRQDIDPWVQVRDFQHAISYARSRADVDGERIGIWGTSFSGGHVLVLGAIDARVRCVVSQVPTISGSEAARRRVPPHLAETVVRAQIADREAIYAGHPPQRRPLIDDGSGEPPVYAGAAAKEFLSRPASRPATFVNNVTLQSLARNRDYEPGSYIARISPTPLLMLVTEHDDVAFTDLQLEAYERALEPKRLSLLPGDHFTPYDETFEEAVGQATDWFLTHLSGDSR